MLITNRQNNYLANLHALKAKTTNTSARDLRRLPWRQCSGLGPGPPGRPADAAPRPPAARCTRRLGGQRMRMGQAMAQWDPQKTQNKFGVRLVLSPVNKGTQKTRPRKKKEETWSTSFHRIFKGTLQTLMLWIPTLWFNQGFKLVRNGFHNRGPQKNGFDGGETNYPPEGFGPPTWQLPSGSKHTAGHLLQTWPDCLLKRLQFTNVKQRIKSNCRASKLVPSLLTP